MIPLTLTSDDAEPIISLMRSHKELAGYRGPIIIDLKRLQEIHGELAMVITQLAIYNMMKH